MTWNFQNGDGTNPRHHNSSSDSRTIRDITAAFEIAWGHATPHAEYKNGQRPSTWPQCTSVRQPHFRAGFTELESTATGRPSTLMPAGDRRVGGRYT